MSHVSLIIFFQHNFCIKPYVYLENSEGTPVIVGSMNIGYDKWYIWVIWYCPRMNSQPVCLNLIWRNFPMLFQARSKYFMIFHYTSSQSIIQRSILLTLSLPAYHCRQWKSWRIYASLVEKGLIILVLHLNLSSIAIIYYSKLRKGAYPQRLHTVLKSSELNWKVQF